MKPEERLEGRLPLACLIGLSGSCLATENLLKIRENIEIKYEKSLKIVCRKKGGYCYRFGMYEMKVRAG